MMPHFAWASSRANAAISIDCFMESIDIANSWIVRRGLAAARQECMGVQSFLRLTLVWLVTGHCFGLGRCCRFGRVGPGVRLVNILMQGLAAFHELLDLRIERSRVLVRAFSRHGCLLGVSVAATMPQSVFTTPGV